jgi:hypothetical protein
MLLPSSHAFVLTNNWENMARFRNQPPRERGRGVGVGSGAIVLEPKPRK